MLASGALLLAACSLAISALALARVRDAETERARTEARARALAQRLAALERSAGGGPASRAAARPQLRDDAEQARRERVPRTVH